MERCFDHYFFDFTDMRRTHDDAQISISTRTMCVQAVKQILNKWRWNYVNMVHNQSGNDAWRWCDYLLITYLCVRSGILNAQKVLWHVSARPQPHSKWKMKTPIPLFIFLLEECEFNCFQYECNRNANKARTMWMDMNGACWIKTEKLIDARESKRFFSELCWSKLSSSVFFGSFAYKLA